MPRRWGSSRSKFGNIRTVVDGIKFPSRREARRYQQLALMLEAKLIQDLRKQVRYQIVVNGYLICTYIADFVYLQDGKEITEDCKGFRTPEYKLKKKLMFACHGINIWET